MISTVKLVSVLTALAISVEASPITFTKRAGGSIITDANDSEFCLFPITSAYNGAAVQLEACGNGQFTDPTRNTYGVWEIGFGNNPNGIRLSGTNYCLDAGSNPEDIMGSQERSLKLWECYPGLAQQTFYYTDDLHIAITGQKACLTFGRYGTFWEQCGTVNDGTQTFAITPASSGPPTTTTSTSTILSTPTTTSTSPTSTPTPVSGSLNIHPNGNQNLCLDVTGGQFYDGALVQVNDCNKSRPYQAWSINRGSGSVSTDNGQYCLDFGTGGGSDGTRMKIWTCYPGLFQQTLYYTDAPDNHIAVVGGNQCLDVEAGTLNVQSWQCSGPDVNQLWTTSAI